MKEYRKIPSLKYLYEINCNGILRNVKSKKVLKPEIDKYGYYRYTFFNKCLERKKLHKLAHQLVMECFGEEKPKWATMIDHIDRNPRNNNIHNLRWADAKINANNRDNSYVSEIGKRTIYLAHKGNQRKIVAISKDNIEYNFDSIKDGAFFIYKGNQNIETLQRNIQYATSKSKSHLYYGYKWYYR